MLKGKAGLASRALAVVLVGALGLLAFGCGGGPAAGNTKDIYVQRFSVPNFSGILLDESVSWVFSHPIDASTLNFDSVRIRTGAQGGDAPRGTFVRGIFLIDAVTNTRVVVDPEQVSAALLDQVQASGNVALIPDSARYDKGASSLNEGRRQVLFDGTYPTVVTFVPEVPSRPDLSDTGYNPGTTYTVVLPAYPTLNVVRSEDGYPLVPRDGRVFVSTFTTVPLAASQLFLGGENEGNPRVVNTQPKNGFRVNVVQGEPGYSGGVLAESLVSVDSSRIISATFEIHGVDRNEQDVTDTVQFSGQSGTVLSSLSFARVREVSLISGSIPEAFRDTVNPANDRDPGVVTFRRDSDFLLFLTVEAGETTPVTAPASFPLDYNVQIENPNIATPGHISELNPGWAIPVLEPLTDSGGQPILDGNGNQVMAVVGVDMRISIRFSQALDPRTITTENFFLEIASVDGRPQVPVSLFLRQSRLGIVEVVLTPVTDKGLAAGEFYEVTISSGVGDLLGSPLNSIIASFEIAAGGPPPVIGDVVESFTTTSKEETAITTANWNGTKPFVGAELGALKAVFAPFAGSGILGSYAPLADDNPNILETGTVEQTVFNYTGINIGIGVEVISTGSFGLVMRAQEDVSIAGRLDLNGFSGTDGQTGDTGDTTPTGGLAGQGGPGGYPGGHGAFSSAGNFDGIDGSGPPGGGAGRGGLSGDEDVGTGELDPLRIRVGGGGGGHATEGTRSDFAIANSTDPGSGLGGDAYGEADFSSAPLVPLTVGVPTLVSGFGGAGGGGGGGEDDVTSTGVIGTVGGEDEGGGGGGGGGGALQIVTYKNIDVSGEISANGGAGGDSSNASTGGLGQGAPGGGGAGGSILLQAFGEISLDSRAEIEALGGEGGRGGATGTVIIQKGGNGGDGYIRFEDKDGVIAISDASPDLPDTVTPTTANSIGVYTPDLALESMALSKFYNQFIPTPNYGLATVDMAENGGTIEIFVQGAREDLILGGPVDPDNDPLRQFTTPWVDISQVDVLDNFQYLRFRVEFRVDPDHLFSDPLPVIREIRIPVSTDPGD